MLNRISSILAYPMATISKSFPQLTIQQTDLNCYINTAEDQRTKVYKIFEKGIVCSLSICSHFKDDTIITYPNKTINITFDLTEAKPYFSSNIKAALIQSEFRIDGTKVQDQIFSSFSRSSFDLIEFQQSILILDNITCTCDTPIAKVIINIID